MENTNLTKEEIKKLASDKVEDKYFYTDETAAYADGFFEGYKKGRIDVLQEIIKFISQSSKNIKQIHQGILKYCLKY